MDKEPHNKASGEGMPELRRENEALARGMLELEWVLGIISAVAFLALVFTAALLEMAAAPRAILTVLGAAILIAGGHFCLVIEQRVGYYVCKRCGHRHVPTYAQVLWAPHVGRTRYMRCPACGQRSWQRKSISKEN